MALLCAHSSPLFRFGCESNTSIIFLAFAFQYDPTIEESYQTTVDIDGKALQVEILDTAGQDEYTPLRETFMHTGDGFLLVFSIVDDQTLEELKAIREQILRVHRDKKVSAPRVGKGEEISDVGIRLESRIFRRPVFSIQFVSLSTCPASISLSGHC